MKAAFLDYGSLGPDLDLAPLEAVVDELVVFDATADSEIISHIGDAEIALTNRIRLDDDFIAALPGLRFIGLTATGSENIDLEAARKYGIGVANIRAYCTNSVVEHVFGVLLTLAHSIIDYRDAVRAGEWQVAHVPLAMPVRELGAMTLGVVGYGELGQGVARVARAFGMKVLVSARPDAESIPDGRVSFGDVLERSDAISLHCPLNETTRGLFDANAFRRMKSSAILVNTARGGLVDSQALVDALTSGEIAAAAVDVLPQEPPRRGDPLLDYSESNLIVTPHIAWATREARQGAIDELAANVAAFIAGERRNRLD